MAEWVQIPGYPYWISTDGKRVRNQKGHILKTIIISGEPGYELRQCGQRDKVQLRDLQVLAGLEAYSETP